MPSSPMLSQTSLIDLITKILNADTNKNPGIYSRYDRLWSTSDRSLGDLYMVSSGDVDALSCAPDSIYEKHGLLIPSVNARDAGSCVWIGFRGDANPESRRYATIWMAAHRGRFMSVGWEECLDRLKKEMVVDVEEDSPSINVASRGLRAPDSKNLETRAAKVSALSSKRRLATQGVTTPNTIPKRMRTHDIVGPSHTRPQKTKIAGSTVDGGARQQVTVAAEKCTNMEQRTLAPLIEGEWIVLDVTVHEDEWTQI